MVTQSLHRLPEPMDLPMPRPNIHEVTVREAQASALRVHHERQQRQISRRAAGRSAAELAASADRALTDLAAALRIAA